jgi:hypothetical protein
LKSHQVILKSRYRHTGFRISLSSNVSIGEAFQDRPNPISRKLKWFIPYRHSGKYRYPESRIQNPELKWHIPYRHAGLDPVSRSKNPKNPSGFRLSLSSNVSIGEACRNDGRGISVLRLNDGCAVFRLFTDSSILRHLTAKLISFKKKTCNNLF